jgi:hypothetical protein
MQYKLTRYEKYKDNNGNITSIFVAVLVDDEQGNSLIHEYWLNSDEIASVLADENNLIPILTKVAAEGTIRLEQAVANKPQPPEIADENKKKQFFPKPTKTDIEKKVRELKAKKTDEPTTL